MQFPALLHLLAENVRDYRHAAGRSQEDVAHAAGLTVRAYGSIERGETGNPGLETLHAVASALGIELADLVVRRRPGPKPKPVKRGRKPKPKRRS